MANGRITYDLPGIIDSGSRDTVMNVDDARDLLKATVRPSPLKMVTAGGEVDLWTTRLTISVWGKQWRTTVRLTQGAAKGLVLLGLSPLFEEFRIGFDHLEERVGYESY